MHVRSVLCPLSSSGYCRATFGHLRFARTKTPDFTAGAIVVDGSVTLSNCILSGNTAVVSLKSGGTRLRHRVRVCRVRRAVEVARNIPQKPFLLVSRKAILVGFRDV
jgi:hypothetical protein